MNDWPRDIVEAETIVRGVCSPYHVSSTGKLKPQAFDPTPDTDEVSVLRHDWIGAHSCRDKAKALEDPNKNKIYRGLAALSARQIRKTGADVVDSRELFDGHADIKHGYIVQPGDPLPPDLLLRMRQRNKDLARAAAYYSDPDPAGTEWRGGEIKPSQE